MKGSLFTETSASLEKNMLARIKKKSMRRGIWFRVLTRAERAQMDLTMRFVEKIRSLFLAKVVTSIVEKLLDAMENKVARCMREVGQTLASQLSRIAQNWGNKSACQWATDLRFIQYLTINHMNTPASFRI